MVHVASLERERTSGGPDGCGSYRQPAGRFIGLATTVAAGLLLAGCGAPTPLPSDVGQSHEARPGWASTAAPQAGQAPGTHDPTGAGDRGEPAAAGRASCPAGQIRDGAACAPWPAAEQTHPDADGCPPGMRRLPPREIAAWTATAQEKKIFKLDCRARPASCHQPARTIDAFCIDTHEVTAAEYGRCVEAGRCTDTHLQCGEAATYGRTDRATHPINCVDHGQAATFCRALGKRLPAREEYGWAQSSGTYDARGHLSPPWGGRYPTAEEIWASIGEAALGGTGPVNGRPNGATEQGVLDLFGNVREWSAPYANSDGSAVVAWLGYSYETTRKTPIGAGTSTKAAPEAYDTATGFRCAVAATSTAPSR